MPTAAAEVTRAAPTYLTSNSLRFTAGLIKHILRDDRGWRFDIALCLVAASLAEGLGVATLLPLIMLATHGEHSNTHFGRAFESALQTIGLSAEVPILIGLMILAISLKAGLLLIAMRHVGALVAKSTTELRLALIRGQLNTEWKHFARQRLGRVAHSIGTEPQRGCMAYLHSAHLFADLAQCAAYLGLALLVSWRLAILALLIGSSALFLLHLPVRRAKWAARQQSGMTTSLTGLLADTLAGIKPLKATAKIDLLGSQLERQTHEMESVTRRVLVTSQAIPVLQEPVLAILTNLAMILAATTLHEPIHNILLMGTILYRVSGKIARAQRNYLSAVTFGQILERLQDGLEKTHEAAERNEGSFAPTLEHGVEFRDANFSHARKPVLSSCQFEYSRGKDDGAVRAVGRRQDHADRPSHRSASRGERLHPGGWRASGATRPDQMAGDDGLRLARLPALPRQHSQQCDARRYRASARRAYARRSKPRRPGISSKPFPKVWRRSLRSGARHYRAASASALPWPAL